MGLTRKYLEQHAENAKSSRDAAHYEAFGRMVATHLLREAAAQVGNGDLAEVKFNAEVTMKKYGPDVCVDVQICTPIGCVTGHVGA